MLVAPVHFRMTNDVNYVPFDKIPYYIHATTTLGSFVVSGKHT